jgi:hypothetical protein
MTAGWGSCFPTQAELGWGTPVRRDGRIAKGGMERFVAFPGLKIETWGTHFRA